MAWTTNQRLASLCLQRRQPNTIESKPENIEKFELKEASKVTGFRFGDMELQNNTFF